MAEPTGVSSLYDLILSVAQAAEIAYYGSDGQQRAMVPVDEHDFGLCLQVVNRGVKRFTLDAPVEGWHWMERTGQVTFGTVETTGTVDSGNATTLVDDALSTTYTIDNQINGYYVYDRTKEIQAVVTGYTAATGTVTVAAWLDYYGNPTSLTPAAGDTYAITDVKTVNGEKYRYFVPDNFGETAGDITYQAGSSVGSIVWDSNIHLRRLRESNQNYGNPNRATIVPVLNRKHELVVDPSPTAAKTVEFPYRVGFNELQAVSGLASGGSGTTLVDSTFANKWPDDYFNNWHIYTLDGTGKFGYAVVTDFAGSTCTFTVADWLTVFNKTTAAATDPTTNTSYYVTDGIEHYAGHAFDFAIRGAILAEAEAEWGPLKRAYTEEYETLLLPRAHKLDARQQPRKRGAMQSGSRRLRTNVMHPADPHRTWTNVTYN